MDTPKTSSVTYQPRIGRVSISPVSGRSFWLREKDINRYRALATACIMATSRYPAPADIRVKPTNSPAEAFSSRLERVA